MKVKIHRAIIYIPLLLLALLCAFAGCHPSKNVELSEKENLLIDSILTNCKDTTALKGKIEAYQKEKNTAALNKAYLRLGLLLRENGCFMEAIDAHRKGMQYAKELTDTLSIVKHLNNIGTNFRRLGILDDASTYHYEALAYCKSLSDTSYTARKNRVISLNGIGNVQLTLKNNEEAEQMFRMALEGEKSLHSELGQAINYANLGAIFEERGQLDSARLYYQQSLLHNRAANSQLGLSLCYTHFGQLYEREGNWNSAIAEYQKAYNLMEKAADPWHWLEACIALGHAYLNKGNLALAEEYINKTTQKAQQLQSLEHLAIAYDLQYQLADKRGNDALALLNYRKSRQYSDSISTKESTNHIQNVRVRYERGIHQQELELMQREYQLEHKMRVAVMTTAVAIILVAILIIIGLWYVNHTRAVKQRLMKQMEDTRTQFFTNITHEFRTPLTVILGLSKELAKGSISEDAEVKNAANIITRQGNGLLDLVNQLLDISKTQSQIGSPRWRHGDVVGYTRMIVESYRPIVNQKQIELHASAEQTRIEMDFVPDYFRKIVCNLLSNAIKFTPNHGHIQLSIQQSHNELTFIIEDSGVGIKPEDLPHIFEPFYIGNTKVLEASTGIGLSLVYQLVHALHGNIEVNSTVGVGTTFKVTLPIQHVEQAEALEIEEESESIQEQTAEVEPLVDTPKVNNEQPIVLITEDNHDIAYYIGAQLQESYQLYYARNGKEALEKALQLVPDLIITDLMMPEMDGLTLTREIRNNELLNHIPIIAITAKVSEEDRIKGLDAGVDAYLFKPFNSDELKVRIVKLLEQRRLLREKYAASVREGKEPSDIEVTFSDHQFIDHCIYYIKQSINEKEPIDLDDIAEKLNVSTRQLNRKIQAITNNTPVNFVNDIKLGKAKQMLTSNPELSIVEVALRCGYSDASYFSRVFKQTEGVTPSQYRKEK